MFGSALRCAAPASWEQEKTTFMKSYNIAVIGGDGTGPEVVREAIKVMDAAAGKFNLKLTYTPYDIGGDRYLKTGEILK